MAQPRVSVICIFCELRWHAGYSNGINATQAVAVGFACVDPRSFDRFALPRFPAGDRAGPELERDPRSRPLNWK